MARLDLTQGHRDGCMRPPADKVAAEPAGGSAMEAWMERAAKKHLHLPWTGKRRDLKLLVYEASCMRP